jgi:hypothetical protein
MLIEGRMPEAIRRKEVHIRRNPSLVPPYTGYTDYRGLHHFESHPRQAALLTNRRGMVCFRTQIA